RPYRSQRSASRPRRTRRAPSRHRVYSPASTPKHSRLAPYQGTSGVSTPISLTRSSWPPNATWIVSPSVTFVTRTSEEGGPRLPWEEHAPRPTRTIANSDAQGPGGARTDGPYRGPPTSPDRLGLDRTVLEGSGEHHGGSGVDAGLLPEAAEEVLQVGGGVGADLEDVVLVSRHGMTVLDLGKLADPIGKVVRLLWIEGHDRDQRGHEQPHRFGIHLRPVRTDHTGLLELAHPLVDAGGRQADLLAHVGEGCPSIALERGQD